MYNAVIWDEIIAKAVAKACVRGISMSLMGSHVYTFEMHRPLIQPCGVVVGGRVHAHYYECENYVGTPESHYSAKGVVFSDLESIEAARQRRNSPDWPPPLYRWCLYIEPRDQSFVFEFPNNSLFRWRVLRGPFYEQTRADEIFPVSCAGPLDILLDGQITPADKEAFLANPYDWNLDGQPVGQQDIDDFMAAWRLYHGETSATEADPEMIGYAARVAIPSTWIPQLKISSGFTDG